MYGHNFAHKLFPSVHRIFDWLIWLEGTMWGQRVRSHSTSTLVHIGAQAAALVGKVMDSYNRIGLLLMQQYEFGVLHCV